MPIIIGTQNADIITPLSTPPGEAFPSDAHDRIEARAGNDHVEAAGGNDRVYGEAGNDTLYGGQGYDTLFGGNDNDWLFGDGESDVLYGNDGWDVLNGGRGADTLYGGEGNDTYHLFHDIDTHPDTVVEYANEGFDKILTTATQFFLPNNVEALQLIGSGNRLDGWGNNLDNRIQGNNRTNSLNGVDGNDTLWGYNGNDTLNGGRGTDTMYGGQGEDTYYVDNVGDLIIEEGSGTDTVIAVGSYTLPSLVENLTLTGGIESGEGNSEANLIDAYDAFSSNGSGGVIKLSGYDGDDTIHGANRFGSSDSIYGGRGKDKLYGYAGKDYLHGGAENDTLAGGNDNDHLVGDSGNDRLYGDSGDDFLVGSTSGVQASINEFDRLWGGSGSDTFALATVSGFQQPIANHYLGHGNSDYAVIKDFNRHQDKIQLSAMERSNYRIGVRYGAHTEIYNGNDLIAVVENNIGLDLSKSYFRYEQFNGV